MLHMATLVITIILHDIVLYQRKSILQAVLTLQYLSFILTVQGIPQDSAL